MLMSAKAGEQLMARLKGFQQMKCGDRPARAVGFFAFFGDHQSWSARLLNDARGDNANHATVPAIAIKDHAVFAGEVRFGGKLLFNFGYDSRFFFLALKVELVQLLCYFLTAILISTGVEFNHVARDVHTSGGVDARAETEADIARGQSTAIAQAGDIHESFETSICGMTQTFQAE